MTKKINEGQNDFTPRNDRQSYFGQYTHGGDIRPSNKPRPKYKETTPAPSYTDYNAEKAKSTKPKTASSVPPAKKPSLLSRIKSALSLGEATKQQVIATAQNMNTVQTQLDAERLKGVGRRGRGLGVDMAKQKRAMQSAMAARIAAKKIAINKTKGNKP
jgi:hypothetical protein